MQVHSENLVSSLSSVSWAIALPVKEAIPLYLCFTFYMAKHVQDYHTAAISEIVTPVYMIHQSVKFFRRCGRLRTS